MTAKVVMTSTRIPIAAEAAEVFAGMDVDFHVAEAASAEDLLRVTRDADAIIALAEPFTRDVIAGLERAKSITRLGIGVETVDIPAATEHGIRVTNVPDGNYREVAVHAVNMALTVTRRLTRLDRSMHETGSASLALAAGTRRPDEQVFGLIGMGRIGRRVAAIAGAIGYTVRAFDPAMSDDTVRELGAEPAPFGKVVETADVLSLHVPLTEQTRNIISAEVIDRMPAGAVLVNVSRGGLVDDAALAAAIRAGRLAGAGIDAYEGEPAPLGAGHPLRGLDNVVLTPHSAHYSEDSFAETKRKALADVARILRGERPAYPVNEIG